MTGKMIKDVGEFKARAAGLAGPRPVMVVAGADDAITLASIGDALSAQLVKVTLVGPEGRIRELAGQAALNLSSCELVHAPDPVRTIERSLEILEQGQGELLMKGGVKTGDLLRGYLDRRYGFRTGRVLSHLGVFNAPDCQRLMMITDGGLNISPDLSRKMDIVENAVEAAHLLGLERPRVAVLAHVEKSPDPDLPAFRDARELIRANREGKLAGCVVDGPFAFDNAVSEEAAAVKGIGGPVAGKADILLAHDIGMGNVIYKVVQVWLHGLIAGIVLGGKFPVITPSRADSEESKLAAIALGVLCCAERRAG